MIDLLDIISPQNSAYLPWILALLILPIFSFATTGFMKGKAPYWSSAIIASNLLVAAYLATVFWNEPLTIRGNWFKLGENQFTYSFYLDKLALTMSLIVNFVALLVHIFSTEYMRTDANKPRYFAYLGLFTFSMMGIVLFNDLLFIFIFWELVGVSSYLLIGFWFQKKSASLAANKAFILNRIGDLGFITGLMILFTQFHSLDLDAVKSLMIMSEIEDGNWVVNFMQGGKEVVSSMDGRWLSAAGIALFCGAVGKSAQFPLQVWLPDAMEGPTPVSALIHAATMVAAGVYMLARIFVLLDAQALEVVAIVGAVTAFMAAIAALSQFDIKKVLAYSTISQLGYMVLAMGVGAYSAGLFHLITHAFFKAGLFLSAGIIIHQLHHLEKGGQKFDPQDMRVMGGLRKKLPVTFFAFVICSLALAGLPGFSGFLSKDAILLDLAVWADIKGGGFYIPEVLAFMTVVLTAFYTLRMIYLVFFGEFRLPKILGDTSLSNKLKEGNLWVTVPAVIFALLSFTFPFGFTLNADHSWVMEALKTPMYLVPESYAATSLLDVPEETFHGLHKTVNIVSILLALAGLFIAWLSYKPGAKLEKTFIERREPVGVFGQISFYHWYQNSLYQNIFLKAILAKSRALAWFDQYVLDEAVNLLAKLSVVIAHVTRWFDQVFVDGLVNLTAASVGKVGQLTRSIQSGNIQAQILVTFIFLLTLILLLVV
jgi:NADH-quinone oxidoreductase subunit L